METEPIERQPDAIVAFDFDGTLTVRDSYTAFLRWRAGTVGYALGLVRLIPALFRYLGDRDRGRLKSAATRIFLAGAPVEQLQADAERFAALHWDRLMRPDGLERWRTWGVDGAHRVIVTASPALTVEPFARRLEAENLIGTKLQVDARGRVTGGFATPNCRALEKVVRLKEAYGEDVALAAAYGDTSGDTEMLAIAAHQGWREFTDRP